MINELLGESRREVEGVPSEAEVTSAMLDYADSVWLSTSEMQDIACLPPDMRERQEWQERQEQQELYDWLADTAWSLPDNPSEVLDRAVDDVMDNVNDAVDAGKNVTYVAGRAVLGVGKLGENAVNAVRSLGVYAMGDHEAAADVAQESVVDDLADDLGDALAVDEGMRDVGDKAEFAGEFAGGIAISVVAPAGAATVAAEALFALGATGEVLENKAEDEELSDQDVLVAVAAGGVSAATAGVAEAFSKHALPHLMKTPVAQAALNKIDDLAHLVTHEGDDIVTAVARESDEIVDTAKVAVTDAAEVATTEADEVVHALETVSDDVAESTVREADDVMRVAEHSADQVAETAAKEAEDVVVEYEYIICRNESLAGTVHPITGVPFERRTIVQESGKVIEGVFSKFESKFDMKLPRELYKSANVTQFKECNRQLYKAIEEDPEIRSQFSEELIEQILDGCTTGQAPDGFVWHHNEVEGVMQLVERTVHERTTHTGGRFIWGGGY